MIPVKKLLFCLLCSSPLVPILGEINEESLKSLIAIESFSGNVLDAYNESIDHNDENKRDVATYQEPITGRTLLHAMSFCDAKDIANDLLNHGANINAQDSDYKTPLHYAAQQNSKDVTALLLRRGDIRLDLQDKQGNTPLHSAINFNNINTAQQLIDVASFDDLTKKNTIGETPLFLAAKNGNLVLVKALCEKGVLDTFDESNNKKELNDAIQVAKKGNYSEVVNYLTKKPTQEDQKEKTEEESTEEKKVEAEPEAPTEEPATLEDEIDNEGNTPLHRAIIKNEPIKKIEQLLEQGADVSSQNLKGETPLHLAASMGRLTAVEALLYFAQNKQTLLVIKDNNDNTPLHLAALSKTNTAAIINRLHEDGAELEAENNEGKTALTLATEDSNQPAIEALKALGAKDHGIDEYGNTALIRAVQQGDLDEVTTLIAQGTAVNSKNKEGNTALHLAAKHGQTAIIQALAADAQLNFLLPNATQKTALHLAAEAGKHDAIIKILELAGGRGIATTQLLEQKDNQGNTSLHLATLHGHVNIMQTLADDVNTNLLVGNQDGKTPLHLAAQSGILVSVNKLLELATRNDSVKNLLDAVDNDGKTPQDLATKQEVIDALENARKTLEEKVPEAPAAPSTAAEDTADTDREAQEQAERDARARELRAEQERERKKALLAAAKKYAQDKQAKAAAKVYTPLLLAVIDQDLAQVQKLLLAGANINSQSIDDKTPLHLAAERRNADIVKILAQSKNCNLLAVDNQGQTALHLAALYGELDAVNILLDVARTKNIVIKLVATKDNKGYTALHNAKISRSRKKNEIIRRLINAKSIA